jgi:transcriptional regulator with XRE-family HTH domain
MDPRRLRVVIAANIRRFAARRKMTIPTLADLAGVARASLYRVLRSDASVTADTIAKLADALDVHPRQLVDDRGID